MKTQPPGIRPEILKEFAKRIFERFNAKTEIDGDNITVTDNETGKVTMLSIKKMLSHPPRKK